MVEKLNQRKKSNLKYLVVGNEQKIKLLDISKNILQIRADIT